MNSTWLLVFFFNDTATTEIYTLSLHDALPIYPREPDLEQREPGLHEHHEDRGDDHPGGVDARDGLGQGRPLRSEEHTSELRHANISYAVFCLKKKQLHLFLPLPAAEVTLLQIV